MLRDFPTPPPFMDLPLDEFRPVDVLGRQAIVGGAQSREETLCITGALYAPGRAWVRAGSLMLIVRAIVDGERGFPRSSRWRSLPALLLRVGRDGAVGSSIG